MNAFNRVRAKVWKQQPDDFFDCAIIEADGTQVETEPFTSQDIMATVCRALGISLETTFTSRSGRPMKIANGGKIVQELFS